MFETILLNCIIYYNCKRIIENLANTDILLNSKVSPAFVAAETIVNDQDDIAFSDNGLECRLSEYIAKVFQSSIDLQSDVNTGQILHSRLENTKYLSMIGLVCNNGCQRQTLFN